MEAGLRKMAAKCSKNTTFLLLIAFALLLDSNAVQGWGRLSEEEDQELDKQLQLINKPAIKSFQTQYGDIVDCIDIYKELAFDHPLLKNHTIQMKPKTIPKRMKDKGSRTNMLPAYVSNISCLLGSIPVKRTTKEDLIMDQPWDMEGFHVRKWNYSRLYISWSNLGAFGSDCINVGCPGFVLVNPKLALGSYLHPSTYKGRQYEIRINLSQGGYRVSWGGHVYSPIGELSPAMGSGHFPKEGYGKSAFVKGIKVITDETKVFDDPDSSAIEMDVRKPYCYNAYHNVSIDPQWGHYLSFGGLGKCTFD